MSWIDAQRRQPPAGQPVLVCNTRLATLRLTIGQWAGPRRGWLLAGQHGACEPRCVSHWHPLPALPTQGAP